MPDEKVGKIVKFFAKPSVAAKEITDGTLSVGDRVKIKGHTTDFKQEVHSMQEEKQPITRATQGQLVGIQVGERVRENDLVYKVVEE